MVPSADSPETSPAPVIETRWPTGVLPAAIFLGIFFLLPLAFVLLLSLSPNILVHFHGLGVGNFHYLFSKPYYLSVLVRTVRVATVTTVVALLIGYPTAFTLRLLGERISSGLIIGFTFPILAGPLVVVLGWMILLADGGPLLGPLHKWNLIRLPHLIGTETAVVIGLVHFTLPFVILSIYSSLKQIPNDLIEAARSLGAGTSNVLVGVIWPLSLPGVISASLIAFSLAASAYVTPYYLGGPGQMMLTTLVSEFILGTYNSQMAAAVSVLLLVTMLAITFAFIKFMSRFVR
jgi:putative spermidine/putrescine transport system permease protein